jgi:hypothetical protein
LGQDPFEKRDFDHREKLLRGGVRQRTEPGPLAAHKDDGFHLPLVVLVLGATVVALVVGVLADVVAVVAAVVDDEDGTVVEAVDGMVAVAGTVVVVVTPAVEMDCNMVVMVVALGLGREVPAGTKPTVMS